MSVDKTVYVRPGIGIGIISLVLSILKLTNVHPVADWSWWWVTVFWWGPVAFILVILLGLAAILGLASKFDK